MAKQYQNAVPVVNDNTESKVGFHVQEADRGECNTVPLFARKEVMGMALQYRNVTVRGDKIRCQRWRTRKKGELVRHNPQLLPRPVTCVGAANHG